MNNETHITNTIFKSKKISFEIKNNYKFVKSTQDIKKGEILLIEHTFTSEDDNIIKNAILNSPELFNNLYPRKMCWSENFLEEVTPEVEDLCYEKTQKNVFHNNGLFSIGLDISSFNHLITPNACVKYSNFMVEKGTYCILLYVYCVRDIMYDEEITIFYSNGYAESLGDQITEDTNSFKLQDNYIKNIHLQYIKKDICKNIIFNHICIIHYGIYFINNTIHLTKRFLEYFTTNVKKECNTENIICWIITIKKKYYNFFDESLFD